MAPLIAKLRLLSEKTKTSIDERNRLLLLKVPVSSHEDKEILKGLRTLHEGLQQIDKEESASNTYDMNQFDKLVSNYKLLLDLYKKDPEINKTLGDELNYIPIVKVTEPDVKTNPTPLQSSLASSSSPSPNKSVRFKENVVDTERFIQPYKDFPDGQDNDQEDQYHDSNDGYQQQQQQLNEQDQHLDRLSQSVSRQHQLSIQIDSELDSHLELLDHVDSLTDRTQDRLAYARKRLDIFSHKARQHGSVITITILILILFILLIVLS